MGRKYYMKFLNFYVDSEDIKKKISNSTDVKDIRFIDAKINDNYNVVEVTCLIESDDERIGNKNTYSGNVVKLDLGGYYIC